MPDAAKQPVVRRGTRLLFAGTLTSQASALARYVILARLLGPEQLGLAATLILVSQFFEMVTDGGMDRFLIQDRDGDAPAAQRLVQMLAIGRGAGVLALLALLAHPLAAFFGAPALVTPLMILGAAPFLLGFLHYDFRRLQRHHDFTIEGRVAILSELAGLVTTVTSAWLLRDFTCVLYGLIAKSAIMVLASHLMAQRRYAIGPSSDHFAALAAFGVPLMLNGLALFLSGQGDRLLIGNQLGVRELGLYSAITLLIYSPSQFAARFMQTTNLPTIAAARDQPPLLSQRIDRMVGQTLLLATAMILGFALCGPVAIPLLFGKAFAADPLVVAIVGALQVVRFVRLWPTTLALAAGRSRLVLVSNLLRIGALPLVFATMDLVGGLRGVCMLFLAAEIAALVYAVWRANHILGRPQSRDLSRLVLFCGIIAAVASANAAWAESAVEWAVAGYFVVTALAILCCIRERETLRGLANRPAKMVNKLFHR